MGEVSRLSPGDFTRFRERSPVPRTNSAGRTCGGAARILAAGSSSWGPGTGLCQVSRRDSRRAGACGLARTLLCAMVPQAPASPRGVPIRGATAVTTAQDRHLSHFIPLQQSVVVAPLVFRMQTGFPCLAALSLLPTKIWFSKNFSLEVCKLCYDDATSTIRMLDPPKERIFELCLTQILPGEYAIARS